MKTNATTLFLILFSFTFAFALHLEARPWMSADGKTIEAQFISADSANVTIRRSDGRTFTIPLGKLSQGDRDFVAEKLKEMKARKGVAGGSGGRPPVSVPEMIIDTSKPWEPVEQRVESAVRSARERPVEDLLEPVHTVRYDGDDNIIWAPNPDGKTWDALPIYFSDYGGYSTVPIIDLGSGELKVENHPRGLGWHLAPDILAPNGKVYISMVNRGQLSIAIYDPAKNELSLDALPVPKHARGETHPLIRSTDGMIFAGGGHTDQSCALIMIDPKDNSVTDFGSCGPSHKPSNAYNYYMGADDTHVYIASGKVPWYLVAVDRKTKQSAVLAKTAPNGGLVTVTQQVHGVEAYVRTGTGASPKRYWCHEGKIIPKEQKCPWGKTGTDWQSKLPPKPEIYTERIVPPDLETKAEFWVKQTVPGVEPDSEHRGWTRFHYEVPLYPMGSDRLIEMPDGRLIGTAGSYTGNYIYDPASGECNYLGKTNLSHYATLVHDNKIWMSGYPSSRLYVFDCAKPWNILKQGAGPGTELASHESPKSNPRLVGNFSKSGCHKMYAAAAGASGDIYCGGRWMRTGNGGGLGWWDPKSNEEDGISEPFSNHQIAFICAAGNGKYIVISTLRTRANVLNKPTPKEGRLFIFDDKKKEIVREIIVEEGVKGPGPIVWAGGNRVIGWTNDPSDAQASVLYGVDVEKGEVAWKVPVPYKLPIEIGSNQEEAWDFRLGPDGHIWTFMGDQGKTLVRINPQTAKVEGVAELSSRGGRLAFSGSDVYLSGTTSLRRIRGLVGDD